MPGRGCAQHHPRDLWLVFRSAGRSLHDLMYEPMTPPAHDKSHDKAHDGPHDGAHDESHGSGSADSNPGGGGGEGSVPNFSVLGPSRWWSAMRRDSTNGQGPMREVLRQLLMALDALQGLNITHRDVKVDNLLLTTNMQHVEADHLTLIDFGSALDSGSLASGLWGRQGPSDAQTTAEYAPPEALFARFWEGTRAVRPRMFAYDMWSVGVVWLELLLGTPDVWALPPATHTLLEKRLARLPAADRASALLLRGLVQWCISPPAPREGDRRQRAGKGGRPTTTTAPEGDAEARAASHGMRGGLPDTHEPLKGSQQVPQRPSSAPVHDSAGGSGSAGTAGSAGSAGASPGGSAGGGAGGVGSGGSSGGGPRDGMVPWECTDGAMLELIRSRDPTGAGLGSNLHAVQLLRSLLQWAPDQRPTARQALAHPYFDQEPQTP